MGWSFSEHLTVNRTSSGRICMAWNVLEMLVITPTSFSRKRRATSKMLVLTFSPFMKQSFTERHLNIAFPPYTTRKWIVLEFFTTANLGGIHISFPLLCLVVTLLQEHVWIHAFLTVHASAGNKSPTYQDDHGTDSFAFSLHSHGYPDIRYYCKCSKRMMGTFPHGFSISVAVKG